MSSNVPARFITPFLPKLSHVSIALGALALFGCSSGSGEPGFDIKDSIKDAEGIWASRGYGWVISVDKTGFIGYDFADGFCLKNADLSGPKDEFPAPFLLHEDGGVMKIRLEDPAYKYSFERLGELPASCREVPSSDPIAIVDVFEALFQTHYQFFDVRNINWPEVMDGIRGQVTPETTETELFDILASAVNKIDDGHVSLRAEIAGESRLANPGRGKTGRALRRLAADQGVTPKQLGKSWRTNIQKGVENDILKGQANIAGNNWIRYGTIGTDIGYLSIMAETDYAQNEGEDSHQVIEAVMNDVMADFKDVSAVILDISLNHGGDDGISRRIARRFTDISSVAYSKHAGDGQGETPQDVYLRPNEDLPAFTGPVYLLTSDHTVSAGEILTLSLKGLPNVTHVGETTRGALSDILGKQLPNGWVVTLSNEIYADGDGTLWEGKGIPPEIELPVFSQANPFEGHTQAVTELVKLIRQ
ncbi:MAG: S41 family peptidase [Maricaulaceae bacterium]